MKKLILLLSSLLLIISCATPISKPIKIHVPAFDVLIVPDSDKFGYWVESLKLLIIQGEDNFGKVDIPDIVLGHEIRHMLYHLNTALIYPDRRRK